MIPALTHLLLVISNSLLAPVIVALLAMFAWALLLLGGLVKELSERRRVRAAIDAGVRAARDQAPDDEVWRALSAAPAGLPKRFAAFAEAHSHDPVVLSQAVLHLEHDVADTVARHSFVTRVSPMLGLMGTLIPLGPALSGLSSGDMSALGGNLIVAFTATVLGLLVSGLAYGIGLVRRAWYSRDVTDLEFVAKRLAGRRDD
jgi:biopolymer transport protein ExbB/TolQ